MTATSDAGGQVVANPGLSAEDCAAIARLGAHCNAQDGITLKLNDFMLQHRPPDQRNDFLYVIDGEVVGYLGLYQFNGREIEISGMVHPDQRRKGIFSSLVAAAIHEIEQRHIHKLIFINQQNSDTGKLFLTALGASYSFSEYWMKLGDVRTPAMVHPLRLRAAASADMPFVAHALAAGFQLDEQDMLDSLTSGNEPGEAQSVRCIVELDGADIGTLAIHHPDEASAFIYGFSILPEHQGRGYGRQALCLAVQSALSQDRTTVELEVACENQGALSLYQSCGFEVTGANDYYVQQLATASER